MTQRVGMRARKIADVNVVADAGAVRRRVVVAVNLKLGPQAERRLETKNDALVAFDAFVETWGVKYDKAVECLIKDRDALLAFYDFPAEHGKHLHTTNPIESSFATVRDRTVRSKGCLSNKTAFAMIFKLAEAAAKSARRLDGHNQLPKIILGVRFTDGIEVVRPQAQALPPDPFRHQNSAIAQGHVGTGSAR